MNRILDMVCDELDKISESSITSANIDRIMKLVDIKYKLMKSDTMDTKSGKKADDWGSDDSLKDLYMDAKRSYRRNSTSECKRTLLNTLEDYMEKFADEMGDMLKDAECQEERSMIQKYINKIREYR